ncbi:MAG TPA: hypothetical protein VIM44_03340, partial [Rariglobus sp.]
MRIPSVVFAVTLLLSSFTLVQASVKTVKPAPAGAEFKLSDGLLQVEFVTDRIARVRSTENPEFSKTPSLMRVPVNEKP